MYMYTLIVDENRQDSAKINTIAYNSRLNLVVPHLIIFIYSNYILKEN